MQEGYVGPTLTHTHTKKNHQSRGGPHILETLSATMIGTHVLQKAHHELWSPLSEQKIKLN